MGDSNGQVELSCPGCDTTFHLRPRKAKMPRNPIPCPKCGAAIEMTDEQIATLRSIVGEQTPAAQVLKGRGRSGVDDSTLDEMERLADELAESKAKKVSSTLIGHPIAIEKEAFQRSSADHKTRESSETQRRASQVGADLSELSERPKTSEIPKEEVDRARASMLADDELGFSSFGSEAHEVETAEEEREDIFNATTKRPPGMPPAHEPLSEVHEAERAKTPARGKVPLSELLKKVREKRDTEGIALPPLASGLEAPESSSSESAHSTDEVFEDIVDDVVGGATERLAPVRETAAGSPAAAASDVGAPSSTGRTENSMLARLKKIPRSGLREKPGMAGERRGSGYIRLPETEILDLLGEGPYRLRVDDIVYEPIDSDSIAGLIKAGKLKAKDEIARSDGDWQRLERHPLFREHHVEPEAHSAPATEPGKSTKQMFGAVAGPPPAKPPEHGSRAAAQSDEHDDSPPPPITKRTSSTSGEWVQTNLDSTLDNLPVAEHGPNTPPPNQAAALEADFDDEPASSDEPLAAPGPDFDSVDDDGYKLDGPPSYPAIELPDDDVAPAPPTAEAAAANIPANQSRSKLPVIAGLLIFGGVVAGAAFLVSTGAADGLLNGSANNTPVEPTATTATTTPANAETETTPSTPPEPTRAEKIAAAVESGNWKNALPLLEAAWDETGTPEAGLALVDAYIDAGEFRRARLFIFDLKDRDDFDTEALDARFESSVERQVQTERKIVEIGPDWSELSLVSTRPLNYRIVDADGAAWRFIPAQGDGITPRAEVAFYQLCGVIDCHFEVPRTVPARISRENLTQLAGDKVSLAGVEFDGDWASGALRRAVEDDHVGFPIESTTAWRNWLDSGDDPTKLDVPFSEAAKAYDSEIGERLAAEAKDVETAQIARQIANILSADYLVNNFDRFAAKPENYGSTVRLVDGRLVSVLNSAAFQPRDSNRVRGRFGWTSRFDPDFVESVRQLERESIDPLLFPDASRAEEVRLDVFWDQRDKFLKRVDSTVARRSRERVMPF